VLALLVMAIVLFGLVGRGALDLVVAAVGFATLVTAHRMLSEPTAATDQQVLLASLLLMAGAAALSGDVWYAACLLAFGIFACLSLGLTVVKGRWSGTRTCPWRRAPAGEHRGGDRPGGRHRVLHPLPRLSWNVAARGAGPGLLGGTTGMTDRVRLGGGGDIKTSARVVLRARLEPSRPASARSLLAGRHFDAFDGREWRGTGQRGAPGAASCWATSTAPSCSASSCCPPTTRAPGGPQPARVLRPANALTSTGSTPVMLIQMGDEEVRFAEDANAYTYVVYSRADYPILEDDPAALEALRALPAQLDPGSASWRRASPARRPSPSRSRRCSSAGCRATSPTPWSCRARWPTPWATSSSCGRKGTASTSPPRWR